MTINPFTGFAGRHVGNMAEFERDFSRRERDPPRTELRSHAHILAAANALIANNRKRLGKNLWTSAGHGEPVRIYEAQSDGYEASWLAEEVQALKRGGLRLADIGVLYRSNAQSRIIEHALFSNGIPYRVYGACASSSAWKSSTRSRICGSRVIRTTTGLPAGGQFPGARNRRSLTRSPAGRGEGWRCESLQGGFGPFRKKRGGGCGVPAPHRIAQPKRRGCLCPRRSK